MKGQEQVITAILLSGILIGIVGSVYLWGIPLIQKNKDISLLQTSEQFMKSLDNKIKTVANAGGRDQMRITVTGLVSVYKHPDGDWRIQLEADTQGTVYATDAEIPLKNTTCGVTTGAWGSDEAGVLCVKSTKLDENNFRTVYTLRYITLKTETIRDYILLLDTNGAESAGVDHTIIIENRGTTEVDEGDRTKTKTVVKIDLV